MSKLMLPNHFTDDERWLTAGAPALALFIAAICYSDRVLSDGRINKAIARRLSLAVPDHETESAISALLDTGYWSEDEDHFWVTNYHEYGLPRAEQERTQEKWRQDKRRQRLHRNGNHDLCDHRCRAATLERSTVDSTAESGHLYPTRHDPTRHDPTLREGRVERAATAPPGRGSGAVAQIVSHTYIDDGTGLYCDTCNLPVGHTAHVWVAS